jgi:hypothetical protein
MNKAKQTSELQKIIINIQEGYPSLYLELFDLDQEYANFAQHTQLISKNVFEYNINYDDIFDTKSSYSQIQQNIFREFLNNWKVNPELSESEDDIWIPSTTNSLEIENNILIMKSKILKDSLKFNFNDNNTYNCNMFNNSCFFSIIINYDTQSEDFKSLDEGDHLRKQRFIHIYKDINSRITNKDNEGNDEMPEIKEIYDTKSYEKYLENIIKDIEKENFCIKAYPILKSFHITDRKSMMTLEDKTIGSMICKCSAIFIPMHNQALINCHLDKKNCSLFELFNSLKDGNISKLFSEYGYPKFEKECRDAYNTYIEHKNIDDGYFFTDISNYDIFIKNIQNFYYSQFNEIHSNFKNVKYIVGDFNNNDIKFNQDSNLYKIKSQDVTKHYSIRDLIIYKAKIDYICYFNNSLQNINETLDVIPIPSKEQIDIELREYNIKSTESNDKLEIREKILKNIRMIQLKQNKITELEVQLNRLDETIITITQIIKDLESQLETHEDNPRTLKKIRKLKDIQQTKQQEYENIQKQIILINSELPKIKTELLKIKTEMVSDTAILDELEDDIYA